MSVFGLKDYLRAQALSIKARLKVIQDLILSKEEILRQQFPEAIKQLGFLGSFDRLPTKPRGYILGFTRRDSLDAVGGWMNNYPTGAWMRGMYLVQDDWFQRPVAKKLQVFPQDGLYHFYFRFLKELYTIAELAYPWPADILQGGE